jgi:GT2 family glycosyltransferase/SAM-dependent methyltransferase
MLRRTLDALQHQTVTGFKVVVVVDGTDQGVPDLAPARVVIQEHGGPGAARNTGARASDSTLLLFLGDDMIPETGFVGAHLDAHRRHPEAEVAVLGSIRTHPEVPSDRVMRWLEWSDSQFAFTGITDDDAGYGRFYSSNVSLKRGFFFEADGFDEDFLFDYEDLDLGRRLHERGLHLLYEPAAITWHHHHYDWAAVERRYHSRALGERLMARKHPWFTPYFLARIRDAEAHRRISAVWPTVVDRVPAAAGPLRPFARERADRWYHRKLAPVFLNAWDAERELEELRAYLGDRYDHRRLVHHQEEVEREEAAVGDEGIFYRTSEAYLYDLTAFAMSGTKFHYLADLRRHVPPGSRVLDYGCGTGSDGLRLIDTGYDVSFADYDNPSTRYLRWRLAQRGREADVFDLDGDIPGGFDAAFSFDVIEHVDDPFGFLAELERRASIVVVNFLDPDAADPHVHRPLPVRALLDHATRRGLLRYRLYHGRSHVVVYQANGSDGIGKSVHSRLQRQLGLARRRATSAS